MKYLKIKDLKSWKRISCLIAIFGGLFFLITTIIAMIIYPGGYSFTNYYFSNLGTSKTVGTSEPNPIASVLFLLACVIAGLSLIPFWVALTSVFSRKPSTKFLSYIGSILGIISSPLLMAIGIFPGDTAHAEHTFSARFFFLAFAITIMLYSVAIIINEQYLNIYSYLGIIFSIFIVLFLFRIFDLINPLVQKIIVYGFMVWVLIQITKIWKLDTR
ncbi:MAG: DUF998 domain-containing protein [Candidatus Lokiarchaeota archaeon]|nr:DUF998 domain-containing protein [Candidatus Lokiarchaeota archaeon]MBD3342405.1 DUF998 domain-containing protein [Candidatus Lokiarchaeota archaeon]